MQFDVFFFRIVIQNERTKGVDLTETRCKFDFILFFVFSLTALYFIGWCIPRGMGVFGQREARFYSGFAASIFSKKGDPFPKKRVYLSRMQWSILNSSCRCPRENTQR